MNTLGKELTNPNYEQWICCVLGHKFICTFILLFPIFFNCTCCFLMHLLVLVLMYLSSCYRVSASTCLVPLVFSVLSLLSCWSMLWSMAACTVEPQQPADSQVWQSTALICRCAFWGILNCVTFTNGSQAVWICARFLQLTQIQWPYTVYTLS